MLPKHDLKVRTVAFTAAAELWTRPCAWQLLALESGLGNPPHPCLRTVVTKQNTNECDDNYTVDEKVITIPRTNNNNGGTKRSTRRIISMLSLSRERALLCSLPWAQCTLEPNLPTSPATRHGLPAQTQLCFGETSRRRWRPAPGR